MKSLALFLLQSTLVLCLRRYDNYTLWKIIPKTDKHLKLLQNLQFDDLDFWNKPSNVGKSVNILVKPNQEYKINEFKKNAPTSDVKILSTNLQRLIENNKSGNSSDEMTFDAYQTLESIYKWLDFLAKGNPDTVTKIIGGSTYEGRNIEGIKISHGPGRKAVFVEGGIHSREWIAISTVCFIIQKLLNNKEVEVRNAAQNYDWYIFPVVNPDGYVRSHTVDRLWRKNTRPVKNSLGSSIGVDLNRNWDAYWMVAGSSNDTSSNAYAGPAAFSEIETRTLSQYIKTIVQNMDMYISFHSYSQMLLVPYGQTTAHLDNYDDAVKIGRRALNALAKRNGTQFEIGSIGELIGPATGGSIDWVKLHYKVPLVYCYELRDTGEFGFLLPPNQIIPSGEEVVDSILTIFSEGKRLGYFS